MLLTLGQAAKLAGKGKTTLTRAIQAGRLSATRLEDGSYRIDPAELCRVYDVRAATPETVTRDSHVVHHETPHATPRRDPESVARLVELETENRMLRELLAEVRESRDDMRAERDDWRARSERLLTDQRPKGRPTSTSAPRPPAAPSEPRSGDVVETSIQSGMAEIRRHLENLRAKAGH
jgi:excisionase family DNA binding protein